jgi:predicted lipid carrier protein YhbT
MSTDAHDEDDIESELALRVAIDRVILEEVEEDAERVIRALAKVVERCKAEGRYSAEDIDAAAAQLYRDLGITRRTN